MSGSVRRFNLISLSLAAWLCCAAGWAVAEEAPQRVVSMNLCTDLFAMALAAPGQLVSVSAIASDPLSSPMAEEAARYPANHGSAEEIFLLQPDLVVAGVWSDPAAVSLLRRLGIRVEQFELEDELSDIAPQLARMGALLGREAEAQTLIRQFESDLATLTAPPGPERAVFYYPNGYTLGPGSLADDVVTTAGYRNIIGEMNRSASGQLALELLVLAAPDLVVTSQPYRGASQAEEILRHPALRSLIAAGQTYQSGPEWACGTPAVLSALRALRDLRAEMDE